MKDTDKHKPLFNARLLADKSRKETTYSGLDEKRAIIAKWVKALKAGKLDALTEDALKGEFLNDVFSKILKHYTAVEVEGPVWNLNIEKSIASGGGTPDGALGFFSKNTAGKTLAVIEMKGAKADLDSKQSRETTPVLQGFGYANSIEGCKWVIVSNFLEIRLYNLPKSTQYYERFYLEDLENEETLKTFYYILCKDNLLSESGKSKTEIVLEETGKREVVITDKLYSEYKQIRVSLFEDIKRNNKGKKDLLLLEKAQKILDRILFICFCEDRGLLPPNSLNDVFDKKPVGITTWTLFCGLFNAIDKGHPPLIPGYNGGLFKKDKTLDELVIADDCCASFKKLAEYDYASEVNVDVLGRIFEQSISDLENLKAEARGESTDKKKSKRKKEGVYYTPSYVTRFIVDQALGGCLDEIRAGLETKHKIADIPPSQKKRLEKAQKEFFGEYLTALSKIRILDPACGSGAFLIAAFDYLVDEYESVYREIAALGGEQETHYKINKAILQDNLFGVDLNPESVEITKLSLWIKTAEKGKQLTFLDDNIKCGNSLIDSPEFAGDSAFDWSKQFSAIMDNGRFDVVIGNPPYVRQELLSPIKPYLEKRYKVYHGVGDLFTYFYEQGLNLLRDGGRFAFISSSAFTKSAFGAPLREHLANNATLLSYVDFGDLQIFPEATTYPAIVVMQKKPAEKGHRVNYYPIKRIDHEDLSFEFAEKSFPVLQSNLTPESWHFEDDSVARLRKKIMSTGVPLKDFEGVKIYRGVLTGLNEAFVIDGATRKKLIDEDKNSEEIIKPFLEGKDIKPWHVEPQDRWLILFKHGWTREKSEIKDDEKAAWEWVKANYSALSNWLEPFKSKAKKRTDKGEYWWELRPCVYYDEFEAVKILYSDISDKPNFSFDSDGYYCANTGYFINNGSHYLTAILNSKLMWFYFTGLAPAIRGGFYRFFSQYVETFPIATNNSLKVSVEQKVKAIIKLTDERTNLIAKTRHRIEDLNHQHLKSSEKLKAWYLLDWSTFVIEIKKCFKNTLEVKERDQWEAYLNSNRQKYDHLSAEIKKFDNELNALIYKIYNLTPQEVGIIDGEGERSESMLELKIRQDFFEEIKNGNKNIEIRVGYPKILSVKIGDHIIMASPCGEITIKVKAIRKYYSHDELLSKENWKRIGPQLKSKESLLEILNDIYPEEKQKLGIYAFEIEVLPEID